VEVDDAEQRPRELDEFGALDKSKLGFAEQW
jgi:hypothetical protein